MWLPEDTPISDDIKKKFQRIMSELKDVSVFVKWVIERFMREDMAEHKRDANDDWFNETCTDCYKFLSDVVLTEEEFDEHPDREEGYDSEGQWHCKDCRNDEEA